MSYGGRIHKQLLKSFNYGEASGLYICRHCHGGIDAKTANPSRIMADIPHSRNCPYSLALELMEAEFIVPLEGIMHELEQADGKHGPMLDPVEGLYTLQCEVMELAREVHRKHKDPAAALNEARQVVVMGIKFLRDCIPQMLDTTTNDVTVTIESDVIEPEEFVKKLRVFLGAPK
jgi:hypothetical protein